MLENKTESIALLNENAPKFLKLLGGKIVDLIEEGPSCIFEFEVGTDYCHSIDIVQGGFVTAMLDAAMSHAVFGTDPEIIGVSSLEIKTTYLDATRAGKLRVEGRIIKQTYKTVFTEGKIFNEQGTLTATASSVAKLLRAKN